MELAAVILAAGQGKRMNSKFAKVLQPLAGQPLIQYVLNTAQSLTQDVYIIYGHAGASLQSALNHFNGTWLEQAEQLGTGHALQQMLPQLDKFKQLLVLYGDVPLVPTDILKSLYALAGDNKVGVLTTTVKNPHGYGRIIRDADGQLVKIIEERDANDAEKAICEINTGIFVLPSQFLKQALPKLSNDNKQNEYYLTDLVEFARDAQMEIVSVEAPEIYVRGINTKQQLAQCERTYQQLQAEKLMEQGVTLADPQRIDIRGSVQVGRDTLIDVNVVLEGTVSIGENCHIGPFVHLKNVTVADNVTIASHTVCEDCQIGDASQVGPFARVRPNTQLGAKTKVGNFVELKNATLEAGAKANHLSYLGDVSVGKGANIGAGTITCNYDGAYKHQTVIGAKAFIGSNSALVAPIEIGANATIGAGSVITRDVPADNLAISRGKQRLVKGWERPSKDESEGKLCVE